MAMTQNVINIENLTLYVIEFVIITYYLSPQNNTII